MTKQIPPYLAHIYSWLYFNPTIYKILNNTPVLNILTLGWYSVLCNELKKEISPHSNILQIGITLGNQINKTYNALGMIGSYTIIDVLPNILENCQKQHFDKRIKFIQANATKPLKGKYDTIICYMLLHELPPKTCKQIVNNTLKSLNSGGKAIFIDYHQPSPYNPLKYFIRAINRLYQPFAEALWKNSIKNIASNADEYCWSKQTYFGGIYQKVVATKEN